MLNRSSQSRHPCLLILGVKLSAFIIKNNFSFEFFCSCPLSGSFLLQVCGQFFVFLFLFMRRVDVCTFGNHFLRSLLLHLNLNELSSLSSFQPEGLLFLFLVEKIWSCFITYSHPFKINSSVEHPRTSSCKIFQSKGPGFYVLTLWFDVFPWIPWKMCCGTYGSSRPTFRSFGKTLSGYTL